MISEFNPHLNYEYFEMCARGTRRILDEGFTPSRGGDISLRDPATGLIYISGGLAEIPFPCSNFLEVEMPDASVFTLDGTPLFKNKLATIELPMHLAIFRARPDINCVLHIHAQWSTVFAMTGESLPHFPVNTENHDKFKSSSTVHTAEYAPAGAVEVGNYVVKALGDGFAAMLANHGAVVVGKSMECAFTNAKLLENASQKLIYEKLLSRRK